MSESPHRSESAPLGLSPSIDPPRPSRLWWLYFGYLVLMGVAGIFLNLTKGEAAWLGGPGVVIDVVATLLNVWGVVGLWAYIQSRRLGWSGLWQTCLGLTVIQWIFAASLFAQSLSSGTEGREANVAIWGLVGLLCGVPLLIALWRYAFLSPRIWRR